MEEEKIQIFQILSFIFSLIGSFFLTRSINDFLSLNLSTLYIIIFGIFNFVFIVGIFEIVKRFIMITDKLIKE